jgi:hypothetical protein
MILIYFGYPVLLPKTFQLFRFPIKFDICVSMSYSLIVDYICDIVAVNVIGVRRKPPICHKVLKNIIVVLCTPRTTSVMIDAECIGSCKSKEITVLYF